MLEPWILWTLLAASMQAVRTATQKSLTAHVSAEAATLVRYLFGIPFVLIYLAFLFAATGLPMPALNPVFLLCVTGAGIFQVIATVLLIRLFTLRNFAVGSTYTRTEIVITAILGTLLFAEAISPLGWVGISICAGGLVLISLVKGGSMLQTFWNQSALYGLGAGLAFSFTSLLIRHGSLSLELSSPELAAGLTLAAMVLLQTVICLGLVAARDASEIRSVFVHWKPGLFVGLTSVAGSAGWFTAFTLERAAYVKTLGQVEILLTLAISILFFKERPTPGEWFGITLVTLGVVVLLLSP